MKVAVVGSRVFRDYKFLDRTLKMFQEKYGLSWIISGGARGADSLAERWAKDNQIVGLTVYIAQWNTFGKSAGMKRNYQIVDNADTVIAFLHPNSKGTWHTIKLATAKQKPCLLCFSPNYYPDRGEYEMRKNE